MGESGAKGRGRERLRQTRRLVVKIGSSSLTTSDQRLDRRVLRRLVADVVELRRRGIEVAVVTSGAVAAGMGRLGMKSRPRAIAELQAAAAVGQNLLMNAYESLFRRGGVPVGQVLLTADDILDDRRRYLNLKNTFSSLFALGAVPIINENDSVAVAELKRQIGENDMLAAYVTSLVEAQLLVILSDVEGLYHGWEGGPAGELIREVRPGDGCLTQGGDGVGSGVGSGGIETKLRAARLVMACGEMAVIAHARRHRLVEIADGAEVGTLFVPASRKLTSRKRWIAFASACRGRLIVDRGAQRAIAQQDRSLLPAGVIACEGEFAAGEAVRVESEDRQELARGLSRYGAAELRRVLGKRTAEVTALLGKPAVEVIHRDDLVLLC
jgi:glutamate 5-kinase